MLLISGACISKGTENGSRLLHARTPAADPRDPRTLVETFSACEDALHAPVKGGAGSGAAKQPGPSCSAKLSLATPWHTCNIIPPPQVDITTERARTCPDHRSHRRHPSCSSCRQTQTLGASKGGKQMEVSKEKPIQCAAIFSKLTERQLPGAKASSKASNALYELV